MGGTIRILNGIPYVVEHDILYDKPIRVERWWPLPAATNCVYEGDYARYCGEGVYKIGYHTFRLPQGGQTKCAQITETSILAPRTRLATRWRDGKWEKQTSRGWVQA